MGGWVGYLHGTDGVTEWVGAGVPARKRPRAEERAKVRRRSEWSEKEATGVRGSTEPTPPVSKDWHCQGVTQVRPLQGL